MCGSYWNHVSFPRCVGFSFACVQILIDEVNMELKEIIKHFIILVGNWWTSTHLEGGIQF